MREILFRAKNKVTLEWEYGSLLQSEIDTNGKCRCAIAERFADDFCVNMVPVIPETVGQFTGQFDKDGKRIFEGDKDKSELIWAFENGSFGLKSESAFLALNYLHASYQDYDFEVIGTIHD